MAINNKDEFIEKFYRTSMSNGTGKESIRYNEDPTVMGFNTFFYFSDTPGSVGSTHSPLFNEESTRDSAINYLKSIDEYGRANKLKRFKDELRSLVTDHPYYFQTLGGLETIMASPGGNPNRMEETLLTFELLESIDLRVSTIINLYREAVYDYKYMRKMVPENLLYFNMVILVSEIRGITAFVGNVFGDGSPSFDLINKNLIMHRYVFDKCLFVFDESNPWLSDLDNKGGESAINSFSVNPGSMHEDHDLRFSDLFRSRDSSAPISGSIDQQSTTESKSSDLPKLESSDTSLVADRLNAVRDTVIDFAEQESNEFRQRFDPETAVNRGINTAFDFVENKIQNFTLGNVFNRQLEGDLFDNVIDFVKSTQEKNEDTTKNTTPKIDVLSFPEISTLGVTNDNNPTIREIDDLGDARADQPNLIESDDLGDVSVATSSISQISLDDISEVTQVEFNFTELGLGNINGFAEAPFSNTLNAIMGGSLGTVSR